MQERLAARGVVSAPLSIRGELPSRPKKHILDVFGAWSPLDEMSVEDRTIRRLPDPIVAAQSILEANFDLTEENRSLPYDVFDALRTRHSIDLTGFNMSMARFGNLYRTYVLMRGGA